MGTELVQKILLFAEKNAGASFNHRKANEYEEFANVEYDDLDKQLISLKDSGLIKAYRSSRGWDIQMLTLAGQEYLATVGTPTTVDAIFEQNRILKEQNDILLSHVDTIRQASERAEKSAQEANRLAFWSIITALVCSLISLCSLPASVAFWGQRLGWW